MNSDTDLEPLYKNLVTLCRQERLTYWMRHATYTEIARTLTLYRERYGKATEQQITKALNWMRRTHGKSGVLMYTNAESLELVQQFLGSKALPNNSRELRSAYEAVLGPAPEIDFLYVYWRLREIQAIGDDVQKERIRLAMADVFKEQL